MVLGEHPQGGSEDQHSCGFPDRKPEKLWVDRGSEFYNKTFKSLLKKYETKLYSTYSDLKAVFIERFNRTLLHIINKPMFINGDGNWVNILNDAVITYNIHSTINMTPVDASNNPDNDTMLNLPKQHLNLKSVIILEMQINVISSLRDTLLIGIELFKFNEILKTQPLTYKIEDMNGEIIEGKYYEQELLKSEFDFESDNKVLESLGIIL